MFTKAYSLAITGIEGVIVNVEADVSDGLPMFEMVGYLSSEVKESKERVKISLKNSGYKLPPKRITVNLSPADIRKEGTAFDLPIAIAILSSLGYISQTQLEKTIIIGELSLNGEINRVNGVLPIVSTAKNKGYRRCIIPKENEKEGGVVSGIEVIGVKDLRQVVKYLNNEKYIEPVFVDIDQILKANESKNDIDFSDITGMQSVKRAIEIAVSGLHNILMIGPPGSGKTMIAKRVPTIMPNITFEESIQISKIYSVSGLLNNNEALITKRPFRSPHHTISGIALVGGGRIPKPGEISLAHLGVLFLDELTEFNKNTLEIMRQPMEDGEVVISRINSSYKYPTGFMLVAAMNPCNCGYYPDINRCRCNKGSINKYLSKISQPLLDRIDISIETPRIEYKDLKDKGCLESSSDIKLRVTKAQMIQQKRYEKEKIIFNSQLTPMMIEKYCCLDDKGQKLLEQAFTNLNLTARTYHRIIKVARTIADLDNSDNINDMHISEAIYYRSVDKKYWEI